MTAEFVVFCIVVGVIAATCLGLLVYGCYEKCCTEDKRYDTLKFGFTIM
jgi:hypothetical protein